METTDTVEVGTNGRVTIPEKSREVHGIEEGDHVQLTVRTIEGEDDDG